MLYANVRAKKAISIIQSPLIAPATFLLFVFLSKKTNQFSETAYVWLFPDSEEEEFESSKTPTLRQWVQNSFMDRGAHNLLSVFPPRFIHLYFPQ